MQTRTKQSQLVRTAALAFACAVPAAGVFAATSQAADPSASSIEAGSEATPSSTETEVLNLVNAERAKENLKPLTFDTCMYGKAKNWSNTMSSTGDFKHQSMNDIFTACPGNRTVGENIAAGQRSPQEVVQAWMKSPGHRANIMNPRFTKLGVGETNHYWTQDFAG